MKTPTEVNSPMGRTKLPCKIMSCSCKHESQDVLHGKGLRVFNPGKTFYKCTVCGNKR